MISVIICSITPSRFKQISGWYALLLANHPHEIIGIHDATSLSEGYTRGVAQSRGDTLVLSHDDIAILTRDFLPRILRHLESCDLIGIAGTTRLIDGKWASAGDPYVYTLITSPRTDAAGYETMLVGGAPLVKHEIQAIDGVLMIMKRAVALAIPFDAETFDGFHLYDLDFSYRAYQAGFRLAVCRDIVIIHESTGTYDAVWSTYRQRFESKHAHTLSSMIIPRIGVRARFASPSPAAVIQNCGVDRLGSMVVAIEQANAQLG